MGNQKPSVRLQGVTGETIHVCPDDKVALQDNRDGTGTCLTCSNLFTLSGKAADGRRD